MSTVTEKSWADKVQDLEFRNQIFIDGKTMPAADGETFDCVSPIDGKVLTQIASGKDEDVNRAVASARQAFEGGKWADRAPDSRKRLLQKLANKVREHAEELALLETLDMGKPISDSHKIDVPLVANCLDWYAEAIDKQYDEVAPTGSDAFATITREPLGVVAAVIPWNFPLLMAAWKLGPALATGNSVIVKPAEQSSLSILRLAELATEVGLPDGVFNVVTGLGEHAGRALGLHPDVDAVAFTGSGEVGKLFMQYAGQSNMKRVSLECGGKSPHIILEDCYDLDAAARAAAFGIFFNQGEVCNAGSRLLVQKSIRDQVIEKVLGWAKKMAPGDPLDPKTRMGAIVSREQHKRVMGYIDKGKQEGAKMLVGGGAPEPKKGGFYVEPTVFDGVKNNMVIAQEEIFGPVLSVLEFETLEEALEIGNQTIYGLAAAVWTRDLNKAHRASRALRAGTVWVNCFDHGSMAVPFGGFKQSGFGRDKSLHALEKYTQLKTTWFNLKG